MRVILDLTTLVKEGKITHAELEKYRLLSTNGTEAFFSNILVGFGVLTFSLDPLLFYPISFHVVYALFALVLGTWLVRTQQQWTLFGTICILMGIGLIGFRWGVRFI